MNRTYKERILDHLWSIAPEVATNSQIRATTGIRSHQQVYLLTQELLHSIGNDRQVPELWLKRYGHLASGVAFCFLADDGKLEKLERQGSIA